jgi:hypothetical protein
MTRPLLFIFLQLICPAPCFFFIVFITTYIDFSCISSAYFGFRLDNISVFCLFCSCSGLRFRSVRSRPSAPSLIQPSVLPLQFYRAARDRKHWNSCTPQHTAFPNSGASILIIFLMIEYQINVKKYHWCFQINLPKGGACFPRRRLRFEPWWGHVGFVVDKVVLGQVFSEYFGFSCQFSFYQLVHILHHISSGAGTVGQSVVTYQVDSVSPHPNKLIY